MRIAIASSLLVLVACGGAQKPAENAAEEKTSTEPAASSAPDMAASTDSTKETKADAPAASAAPAAAAAAPATAPHAAPAVTGSIDGKPFQPTLGRVTAKMQKDGRVVVTLLEHGDCKSAAKAGDAMLTMTVPWNAGEKADLSALKRSAKGGPAEIGFARIGAGNKKDVSSTFKPSGTVTILAAPTAASSTGKMKIDLQSGDYMLAGDLDIEVCVAPK